ncbi:hypothetical protein [Aurantiacibacter gilvus]|uniref:Uncharacterized protein n=1 Tax=Aurantiacibacter gilvus TaxID=3139141 RepID=A0ABU9IFA9_9SPHN
MVDRVIHKPDMTEARPDKLLLRRLGQHLRRQDWFAVTVEFVVVVVGVFLGLQVNNWNVEAQERRDERAILERLHEETGNLLEVVRAERASLQTKVDALHSVQPVIFSMEPVRPLTAVECEVLAYSHVYRKPSDELPILDEMMDTGRFDRLQDPEVRQMLRSYILFRERQRSNHEERTNELYRLYSRHPDAISMTVVPADADHSATAAVPSNEAYEWRPVCDVGSMLANQQFLNETFDNMGRNSIFLSSYAEREEMLTRLQQHLAELVGS